MLDKDKVEEELELRAIFVAGSTRVVPLASDSVIASIISVAVFVGCEVIGSVP